MLGGSIITLGSDICEKSGSSGINCLEEVAGFGNSLWSVHSQCVVYLVVCGYYHVIHRCLLREHKIVEAQ